MSEEPPPRPAGFWRRFAALLIDAALVYAAAALLGVRFENIDLLAPASGNHGMGLLGVVVWWLYFALLESSSARATVGKALLGIEVVDVFGERIGFLRATSRYFGKSLSALPVMAGFVMAPFTQRRQALHDLLAGTLVVHRWRPESSAQRQLREQDLVLHAQERDAHAERERR